MASYLLALLLICALGHFCGKGSLGDECGNGDVSTTDEPIRMSHTLERLRVGGYVGLCTGSFIQQVSYNFRSKGCSWLVQAAADMLLIGKI